MLCWGDRTGFRRAKRANPQGGILAGGADKAERDERRARLGREAVKRSSARP